MNVSFLNDVFISVSKRTETRITSNSKGLVNSWSQNFEEAQVLEGKI